MFGYGRMLVWEPPVLRFSFQEKNMGKHFAGVRAVIIGMMLSACLFASAVSAGEWSFAHNSTEVSPWNQGVEAAVKYLNENSGGKFKGKSFPNGVLFQSNWEILLEMTQTGSVQVGVEAMSALANLQGKANFMCLPFLFQDNEHVNRFLDSNCATWDAMMKSFEDKGVVVLGIAPRPMRQISNNKRKVEKFEDLKGLILRSPSNRTIIATMEAVGIKAVPLPSSEIYSAIQLGTVDGEDNSLAQQYDAKTYEVIKYFTIWNYVADGSVMFMNKDLFDKCTPDEQKMLKEMGRTFAKTTYAADDDYFKVARDAMLKKDIEIIEMSNAEKERCAKACESVYGDFKKNFTDAEWKDLMDSVEKTKK